MKTIFRSIILSILVIGLASCNAFVEKPTETPVPTATSLPTSTPEPTITPTIKPTKTSAPPTETSSAPPVLPTPSGKPLTNWEGIPVMPNAIAGEGDSKGYSFTINASLDEVKKFYEKEMTKLGWKMLASGQGTTGAIMLIFTKDSKMTSMSIVPQPDNLVYVLLVK